MTLNLFGLLGYDVVDGSKPATKKKAAVAAEEKVKAVDTRAKLIEYDEPYYNAGRPKYNKYKNKNNPEALAKAERLRLLMIKNSQQNPILNGNKKSRGGGYNRRSNVGSDETMTERASNINGEKKVVEQTESESSLEVQAAVGEEEEDGRSSTEGQKEILDHKPTFTLKEYEAQQAEKKRALEALKKRSEQIRKVDQDKEFVSMKLIGKKELEKTESVHEEAAEKKKAKMKKKEKNVILLTEFWS